MSAIFNVGTPGRSIKVSETTEGSGKFECQDKLAGETRWKPLSFLHAEYLSEIAQHGIRENNPEVSDRLKSAAKTALEQKSS